MARRREGVSGGPLWEVGEGEMRSDGLGACTAIRGRVDDHHNSALLHTHSLTRTAAEYLTLRCLWCATAVSITSL
jgi:hypothetical protein